MHVLSIAMLKNMTNEEILKYLENSIFLVDNITLVLAQRLGQEMLKVEQLEVLTVVNNDFVVDTVNAARNIVSTYDEMVKNLPSNLASKG